MSSVPKTSTQNMAENYERFGKLFEKKDKEDFSMENFFNLLMAEISNQDPLEPMSNTEFVSQLANFTALKAQQDALYYQNANYAQSLVGKTVTVGSLENGKFGVKNGIVTSMNLVDGEFSVRVEGKDYALNKIMEVLPTQNPYQVSGSDGAYANSLIGKQVTVMVTNSVGQRITEEGVVTHVEIKNHEASVIIAGMAYPLSSVVKVENAKPAEEGQDTDGTTFVTDTNRAYATSLIGKTVSILEEDSDEDIQDEGVVTRVDIKNGKISVVINGENYDLSRIASVSQT